MLRKGLPSPPRHTRVRKGDTHIPPFHTRASKGDTPNSFARVSMGEILLARISKGDFSFLQKCKQKKTENVLNYISHENLNHYNSCLIKRVKTLLSSKKGRRTEFCQEKIWTPEERLQFLTPS